MPGLGFCSGRATLSPGTSTLPKIHFSLLLTLLLHVIVFFFFFTIFTYVVPSLLFFWIFTSSSYSPSLPFKSLRPGPPHLDRSNISSPSFFQRLIAEPSSWLLRTVDRTSSLISIDTALLFSLSRALIFIHSLEDGWTCPHDK